MQVRLHLGTLLTQDVDYLVRRCMCEQLGAIGRAAGKELLLKSMLDELFELLKDEEVPVGAGCCLRSSLQLLM